MSRVNPLSHVLTLALPAAVCCLAIFAAGAVARPTPLTKPKPQAPAKLLSRRSCKGLLTIADLPGTATESSPGGGEQSGSENYATACQFFPPAPAESEEVGSGPVPGVVLDELAVYGRRSYEFKGRPRNLLLAFGSLPDSSRYPLHGIGTRAYYEIDNEGDAEGFLQVRNDAFTVTEETVGGISGLLSKVAIELSPSGR